MKFNKNPHEEFAKFFDNPTRTSLRTLIQNNIGETDYLDFKEAWVEYPKLAKHILAFANTQGGALIIGIKENKDGTTNPVGIKKLIDKEKINKGLKKYLPNSVIWEVYDFVYKEDKYPKLQGRKFQVLIVEYDPKQIPILCLKSGDDIKSNVLYIRNGTSTTEANHNDVQQIINKRLDTGYSSKNNVILYEHLEQLKTLYKQKENSRFLIPIVKKDYYDFLSKLIKQKRDMIDKLISK